jgi:hypothetical protein
MASIKLGTLLLKANVLTEQQLTNALTEQQKWGGRLGEILVRMNILTEEMLVKALSKQLNVVAVNLDSIQGVPPHVRAKIPSQVARDLSALPLQLRDDAKTLVVAMSEPQNLGHIDTLRSVSRCRILPQIAGRSSIARAFGRFYEGEGETTDVEGSFKFVDAQGNTVVKQQDQVSKMKNPTGPAAPSAALGFERPPPVDNGPPMTSRLAPARMSLTDVPASIPNGLSPAEQLTQIEEAQRKEVAALKGMVELLIEKGVFSREEYLAKVRK